MEILSWLQQWSEVISGLGSLALSAGLVYLYYQQKNLLRRDLNREVRSSHTETLRQRVRIWHGRIENPELNIQNSFPPEGHLPKVRRASIEPAPPEESLYNDNRFRVVPEILIGDKYLEDLLENHAPELKQTKEEIESLQEDFTSLRSEFIEKFDGGQRIETEEYVISPTSVFSKWVFERAVMVFRENIDDDKDKLCSIAESCVEDEAWRDNDKTVFPGARENQTMGGYKLESKSLKSEDYFNRREEFEDKIKNLLKQHIQEIEQTGVYKLAADAAEILDETDDAIRRLERILVEYEGRPLYSGNCDYIEESRI